MTLSIEALSEVLFVIGAVLIGIVPRYRWNPYDWIGGGNLTYRFRQALVILALLNISRNVCLRDRRFLQYDDKSTNDGEDNIGKFLYFLLLITESVGLGFLMLLTPYFLQCHLASLINIKAGRDLVPWLYLIILLDILGAIGFLLFDRKYYCLKRLGDAVSSIPILQTLSMYQLIMSRRESRVTTIQTVQMVERYSFFLTTLASGGYFFIDDTGVLGQLSHAVRLASIFMTWTRATFHAMLLNLMDEAIQLSPPGAETAASSSTDESSDAVEEVNDVQTLALVNGNRAFR